jgi:hypothetical protein
MSTHIRYGSLDQSGKLLTNYDSVGSRSDGFFDCGHNALPVYRHIAGGKERARDHALYKLLHDRFNPEMSSFVA